MTSSESLFAARLAIIAEADDWLDGRVAASYKSQPLAQHWARVAKVGEEGGEAIEKLIAWTGQNPRKPQRDEAREELLAELADVAITATLAIQHFTKDADETAERLDARLTFLYDRMRAADPEWFERAVTAPETVQARCTCGWMGTKRGYPTGHARANVDVATHAREPNCDPWIEVCDAAL